MDSKDNENSNNNKVQVNNLVVIGKSILQNSSHDKSNQPELNYATNNDKKETSDRNKR